MDGKPKEEFRAGKIAPVWVEWTSEASVIRLLASIFRGLSYIVGMTAPPPGEDERQFVLLWLGITAFVVVAVPVIFYVVLKLSVR